MIHISSPTRVDLAGGTLDMWPLYMCVERAITINLAIDIQTHVELLPLPESNRVVIESVDLKRKFEFANFQEFLRDTSPELKYFQKVTQFFEPQFGFSLKTRSESPVGGGLGGSSSLLISLMKSFSKMTGVSCGDTLQMTSIAHNLEASILQTPTGTQDYVPAITGGLNILEYSAKGMSLSTMEPDTSWHDHFLLVHTGKSHHSGLNNFEVLKSVVSRDVKTLSALHELADISQELKELIEKKRWDEFPKIFLKEYNARVLLAEAFSSPEIKRIQDLGLSLGVPSVKICGAGGGGCVLIWCDSKKQKDKVEDQCRREGFNPLPAKPVGIL